MRALIVVELLVAMIGCVAFVGLYGGRSDWRSSSIGRNVMWFMSALGVVFGSLAGLAFWRAQLWIYALIFAAVDVTVLQRVWLLWRAQRKERDRI